MQLTLKFIPKLNEFEIGNGFTNFEISHKPNLSNTNLGFVFEILVAGFVRYFQTNIFSIS